ncbi:Fanconi anemia group B protein [Ambystoma mexicanum]|uniref:Fanconi anemia group B protein n=1 Tax=Ambystoma mexicanum TaxID=8296 RepID=UPI0037E96CE9
MSADAEQECLLSHNGEIILFQLSKSAEGGAQKTSTTLHFRRMPFDTGTGNFSQAAAGRYCFQGGNLGVRMICCRCVADYRTGLTLPCVLISKRKKRPGATKYVLLLLQTSNGFECCLKFQLDQELTEDVHLCEGPTVLWRCDRTLYYVSARARTVLSAPVEFSSLKWAGGFAQEGLAVVGVRGTQFPEGGDDQRLTMSDGALWGSEFIAYALEKQTLMTGTCLLPHGYSCVVTCMEVYVTGENDDRPQINVVAVTSKKQLVWFQDGTPKDVCQLPFEEPSRIQVASTGSGDLLFAVFFNHSRACAVWKNSFQIACTWQDVKTILVDDFIGTGTQQVLVLFEDASSNSDVLSRFHITDFAGVNYESDLPISELDAAAEDGLQNRVRTMQALEMRLQAGMACVQELQQHLQLKKRVLLESCAALMDLARGREHALPSALEEGLLPLWDDDENNPGSPPEDVSELPSQNPENPVERVWQRVVDDSWVVGVKLTESVNLSLSDVTLSLLMEQGVYPISPVTSCHGDVLRLARFSSTRPVSAPQMEPLPKRVKLGQQSRMADDGGDGPASERARTVTAVTELSPLLAFRNVTCLVLLHAKRRRPQKEGSDGGERLTLTCGRISLRLEDVLTGTYSANLPRGHCAAGSQMDDLLAFRAAFHRFAFQVQSPDCTLTPVKTWLLERMKCTQLKQCPEYLLYTGTGDLKSVLFKWRLGRPTDGTLTVYCRNQAMLFQFLHSLIGILPPSCVVKSLMLGSKDGYMNNLAHALEEELLSHKRSLTSVINEVEKEFTARSKTENKVTASISNTNDAVQRYREELQSDQMHSRAAVNLTLSAGLYREIAIQMAQVQLNTDRLAQKLSYF